MSTPDWSIQQIARLAGTTSRTLRHYGDVGLLKPSRIGTNGYRYYDQHALARLQRILLLRDLGLGIPAILDVLAGQHDNAQALAGHLEWLNQERDRLDRQIRSVEATITTMREGGQLMAKDMFDGFDHTVYKDEVEERWGREAYADSDAWWRGKSEAEKAEFATFAAELAFDWMVAATGGVSPESAEAQALAKRQADWFGTIPGTPRGGPGIPSKDYYVGVANMYVTDERFVASYGGLENATFVRDAMRAYAETSLAQ